ncbi:MAG: peroxidase family protein [Dehalococcoidia bacterium]
MTNETSSADLRNIEELLDQGEVGRAIEGLRPLAETGDSADVQALLGLALFRSGDYSGSVTAYERAVAKAPGNATWTAMLGRARANAEAEISVYVPEVQYASLEELLAPAASLPDVLPSPLPPAERSAVRKTLKLVGDGVGFVLSFVVDATTEAVGRFQGYKDEVWTNWYRKRLTLGILTLAYIRTRLNRDNLRNTYPKRVLIGFQPEGQTPPSGVTQFRTADGSWNNLEDPKEGAAGTRFPRNVRNNVAKAETGERLMTPNPRLVSRKLLTREGEMKEVPFLNMLAASWINFQNHDWISHGQNLLTEVHEIPMAEDDPARITFHQRNMFIGKTQPDLTRRASGERTPTTFINEVTHWWDGSQIYGSDWETVERLRSLTDGKLRLNADGTLPVGKNGVEESGFIRDWWIGLAMLHNLFAREHNAICDELKKHHPEWDDNRLFNVARLINAAVMAKIHSVEWTPAILPNPALADALNANWYGVLTNLLRRGSDKKTLAPINVRNPEMGGVVGNPINKHGQPYGLTEEFVEVYRLHSLLPETLTIRRVGSDGAEALPFPASRQAGSVKLSRRVPMADLFYSFGNQHPGQLVLGNYPRFMQELSIPGNPVFDMAAVDILRARERGVPRYNEFRRQLGLNPIRKWEDLTKDPALLARLREVYGEGQEGIESLDLMVGTLGEEVRPTGFGFGETLFQIFILNASRRLQADRFFTDDYNADIYTQEGLDWIDRGDLKTVILRHYPELAKTGLANVKNAFEPWDEAFPLKPERHPLRGFDRELKKNPWGPPAK